MALRIQERGEVVKGVPVVEPGDDLFWFNRPRLILYLINFVLFQNAFQVAFFAWTWVPYYSPLINHIKFPLPILLKKNNNKHLGCISIYTYILHSIKLFKLLLCDKFFLHIF